MNRFTNSLFKPEQTWELGVVLTLLLENRITSHKIKIMNVWVVFN